MIKKISKKLKARKSRNTEKKLQKALKRESKLLSSQKDSAYDKAAIAWTASEYIKHRKGTVWHVVFLSLFLGGACLSFMYNSWSFSLALVIFAAVYLLLDRKHPKNIKIKLSEIGMKVGNKVYQYNRIRAFWIAYNPPFVKVLNIRVHNEYLVDIEIQLGNQDPGEVYELLSKKLPEIEGKEEGFFDQLIRSLRI